MTKKVHYHIIGNHNIILCPRLALNTLTVIEFTTLNQQRNYCDSHCCVAQAHLQCNHTKQFLIPDNFIKKKQ